MANKQPQVIVTQYSLTDQEIQIKSRAASTHDLAAQTDLKVGGYTCWWSTREGAEKCCAGHKHAGPVENINGSYTCYVDKGTWDSD
ncbi:MAG: hypothetical protein R3E79_51245 [Caldilineaceae bacterium]